MRWFDKHVTNVVRACTFHTRALQHIRPLLTLEAVKAVAVSVVGSRLDYCNSLLYGTELNCSHLLTPPRTVQRHHSAQIRSGDSSRYINLVVVVVVVVP